MSLYQLVFRKSCNLPVELEYKALCALKALNLDWTKTSKERVDQLNKLDEFRFKAYESSTLYKKKMKKWHDSRILKREFKVGDWVLLYNSRLRLFLGKFKSKWSGSFGVTRVLINGAIKVEGEERLAFKVQEITQGEDSIGGSPKLFSDPDLVRLLDFQNGAEILEH
ncbi:uncharacterized protein LOC125832819 [Solanum verrucosum]|uniref:uncharacterized protein LOC125832819 n=1 Tax=Solanum verrucosum TaxID=315347 RepID=UPI0020CFFE42|nr:uncharacterized protein LOC125832819 [Solanum verrucosum]